MNFDIYLIAELNGSYKIAQDSASLSLGLSVGDMIEAEQSEPMSLSENANDASQGLNGGSMKGWRKFVRWGKRNLGRVNSLAQKAASLPGMSANPYLQGGAKILAETNALVNGAGYRGSGLLRM